MKRRGAKTKIPKKPKKSRAIELATSQAMRTDNQSEAASTEECAKPRPNGVFLKRRHIMDLTINAFYALAAIAGVAVSLLGYFGYWKHRESLAIWLFYGVIVFSVTALFLTWQKRIWAQATAAIQAETVNPVSVNPDRAYVVLSKGYLAEPPSTGNYPIATLEFQNTGNTPAVNVRISCNYSRLKEKAKEQAEKGVMPGIPQSPFGSAAVVGKGQVVKFVTEKGEWNHPEARRLWMDGTFVQYLWGEVYFEDIFGQKHITHFCAFSERPDSHRLTFCLHGNKMEDTEIEPNRLGASPATTPQALTAANATPLSIADRPYVVVEAAYVPDLVPNRPLSPVITIVNKGRTPAQHLAASLEIAAKPGFAWVLGFGKDSGRRPVSVAFLAPGDRVNVQGAPADAVTLETDFFNNIMAGKESFMIHGKGTYDDMTGKEYPIEYAFGYHAQAHAFMADFGGPNRVEKWQDEKEKKRKN